MSLDYLLGGGQVKRYHTVQTIRSQNVAEHTWNLLTILFHLEPTPSLSVIKAAHYHDVHERETGDIPATAKWNYPQLGIASNEAEKAQHEKHGTWSELLPDEARLLKFCDMLELVHWTREENKLGNSHILPVLHNGLRHLFDNYADMMDRYADKVIPFIDGVPFIQKEEKSA